MTSFRLATSSLLHRPGRTAVSVTGAAFAVVLVFMQLGFLGSVSNTATLLYDRLRFDIMITSSEYIDLSRTGSLERGRLAQAYGGRGVKVVIPLTVSAGNWRNPTADPDRGGRVWQLSLLGVDPGSLDRLFLPSDRGVFTDANDLREKQVVLGRTETALLDRMSRPDFGDPAAMPPGTRTELNGRQVELAGYFRAGTGFSYSGLLIMSEQSLQLYVPHSPRQVTFGLLQLEDGTDPDATAEQLRASLPADARVFTRKQLGDYEREYWVKRTAVGQFFYFGVLLAITVGGIFIYQMMVADIKKHLPEYATLKAMGYRFGYLFRVVLSQSILLALIGYSVGLAASLVLYEVTKDAARLPISMTPERIVFVLILTVGMCAGSGLLAVRKVQTADPAELF